MDLRRTDDAGAGSRVTPRYLPTGIMLLNDRLVGTRGAIRDRALAESPHNPGQQVGQLSFKIKSGRHAAHETKSLAHTTILQWVCPVANQHTKVTNDVYYR